MKSEKIAQIYKGNYEEVGIKYSRVWSMPTPWTFQMQPVKALIEKYVKDGKGWVDPFAGKSQVAEYRNDHREEVTAEYGHQHCLEAVEYSKLVPGPFNGVLFDPPYSLTQIKQHYQSLGKPTGIHTGRMGFYEKVKSALCEKVKPGGYAISFGWNTNGFGKARGFKIIEIMSIAHGGSKNDTTVTVEVKQL